MTHFHRFILSLILAISGCAPAYAQTIFWTRPTPGTIRDIWIYGRELWAGPEKVAQYSTITLKSATGEYTIKVDNLHGANDQDANRALPYLQRFRIADAIPAGVYALSFTRNDGATDQVNASITLPPADERPNYCVPTAVKELASTLILKQLPPGEWHDLQGAILTPSKAFPANKPLVYIESGAWVKCGVVWLPEGSTANRAIAFAGSTKGVRLEAIKVINQERGEIGIEIRGAEDAFFHCVDVVASRCVDANPSDCPRRNTFLRCSFESPRGSADGQIGRGIGGEDCLVAWSRWHDIDRGPTLSPQGSPASRSAWFECSQSNTGITEGASEGLLTESKKLARAKCQPIGRAALLIFDFDAKDYCKTGLFVFIRERDAWARIVTAELQSGTNDRGWRVTLDKDLGSIPGTAYVGNACVENAFIRCRFWNGKSGLWFWGASQSNVVTNCDFRDLDFGILTMQRDNPPGDVGFSRQFVTTHNRFRRVVTETKVQQ